VSLSVCLYVQSSLVFHGDCVPRPLAKRENLRVMDRLPPKQCFSILLVFFALTLYGELLFSFKFLERHVVSPEDMFELWNNFGAPIQ
jgi:hypothetical protein